MTEIIKKTIITNPSVETPVVSDGDSGNPVLTTQVKTGASNRETTEYVIYYIFGFLEILLGFRLVLKIVGASSSSGFVRGIYAIAGILTLPFEGIFRRGYSTTSQTTSVFEPATLVALIVYPLLAWGIVKLIKISSGEKQ
jgi:hypothetical protein